MMLNRLADGDATVNHRLIVRQVKHQQVALIAKNACNRERTFLTDAAVGQMEICQRFIVLDTIS